MALKRIKETGIFTHWSVYDFSIRRLDVLVNWLTLKTSQSWAITTHAENWLILMYFLLMLLCAY